MNLVSAIEASLYVASQERTLWRLPFPLAANKRVLDCENSILRCTTAINIAARHANAADQMESCQELTSVFGELAEQAAGSFRAIAIGWEEYSSMHGKQNKRHKARGKMLEEEWTDGGTVVAPLLKIRPLFKSSMSKQWNDLLEELFVLQSKSQLSPKVALAVSTVYFFSTELVSQLEELAWSLRVLYDRQSPTASASARITSLDVAM